MPHSPRFQKQASTTGINEEYVHGKGAKVPRDECSSQGSHIYHRSSKVLRTPRLSIPTGLVRLRIAWMVKSINNVEFHRFKDTQ